MNLNVEIKAAESLLKKLVVRYEKTKAQPLGSIISSLELEIMNLKKLNSSE